jgi:hypothetical protein
MVSIGRYVMRISPENLEKGLKDVITTPTVSSAKLFKYGGEVLGGNCRGIDSRTEQVLYLVRFKIFKTTICPWDIFADCLLADSKQVYLFKPVCESPRP